MNTNYTEIYADFLKSHIALKKPLKIVCDSSNGPAGMVIQTLQKLNVPNLELISINDTPDPDFPAHGPNPLKDNATDQASKKVLELGADFGVIFDADGDRAFFVDEKGTMLPSFMTSILLFKINKPPFIADELVYKSIQHVGVIPLESVVPARVGSRFIKEELKAHHASAGAEFSGHFYFKDFFGADSGIFTMIQVANTVSSLDTHLSHYFSSLKPHVVAAEEIKLGDKKWADIEPKIKAFAEAENIKVETREGLTLDTGSVWVNARTSNTEPIVRLIGGGATEGEVMEFINKLKALV